MTDHEERDAALPGMDGKKPLRILGLSAENFQRLRVVELNTDGSLVVLKGANGAGKSSILDSIPATLGGKGAICAEPLRRGTTVGHTTIEIGPEGGPPVLIAHRTYSEDGPGELRLEVPGSGTMSAPQTALEKITGVDRKSGVSLSFDPEAFRLMAKRERAEYLLGVVGLDFRESDVKRKQTFDQRTEVGRAQKRASTLALNARPEDQSASFNPTSQENLDHLATAVDEARQAITAAEALATEASHRGVAHDHEKTTAERTARELVNARGEVERLEQQFADDTERREEAREAQARAVGKSEAVDSEALHAAHDEARQTLEHAKGENLERARVADLEETLVRLTTDSEVLNARWSELSAQIDAFDDEKRAALFAAEFPVSGLSVNEDYEVLLDDLPFDQASGSDQLRVSVAIPMALNPLFPLAIVRRGSDLDPDQITRIHDQVVACGGQVWLEMVYTDENQGSIVEVFDGEAHSP